MGMQVRRQAVGILDSIGETPLLGLRNISPGFPHVEIYAKAEWFNASGSVKDRAALNMILEGERSGRLTPEKKIIDATSGNTGIAYAMIGAAKGYAVKLFMPENGSFERKHILRALGAELVLTDPLEGMDGAIREVRRIHSEAPERYFYPDQHNNPANWKAHYHTTAVEIYHQTGGRITHFVAGLGTSGTFVGTGRRLKKLDPRIQNISVQPDSSLHGLEGLKHMATDLVPGIYDPHLADDNKAIPTEEAYAMVKRLAREEGLFVGVSSGAAMAGALRVAQEIHSGVIAVVFPDGGNRYLSSTFWDE